MRDQPGRAYDVFLSYASKDKNWANAACAVLERERIRCWVAPRDIIPGEEWGSAIIQGINSSRVMVLIFSGHANASGHIHREVERAISRGMAVIPVRVENVPPEGAMAYALSNRHWLEAFTPPIERHLESIARSVRTLLGDEAGPVVARRPAAKGAPVWSPEGTRTTTEPDRPRAFWPVMMAALFFGAVAMGFLILSRQTGRPETESPETLGNAAQGGAARVAVAQDTFQPLFNGKDTAGWKTHPSQPGNWTVADGLLRGTGPDHSYLYTERDDFEDFHLRVEARINEGGNSGVYTRATFGPVEGQTRPNGYETQIDQTHHDTVTTGGLYVTTRLKIPGVPGPEVPADQWFVLDIVVEGDRLIFKVNDRVTIDYRDDNQFFSRGHIALQVNNPETVVEFRKIEIKELIKKPLPEKSPNADASPAGTETPATQP